MNPDRTKEIWAQMFPCPHHRGTRITPLTCWTRQKATAPANGGKPADALIDPECAECSQGAKIRDQVEKGEIVLPGKRKTPKWTSRPAANPIIHQPMVKGQIHRPVREEAVKETVMPKRRPGRPPKRKEVEASAQTAARTGLTVIPKTTPNSCAPWAQGIDPSTLDDIIKHSEVMLCKDPACRRAGQDIPVVEMAHNWGSGKVMETCLECHERKRIGGIKRTAAIKKEMLSKKPLDVLFDGHGDLLEKLTKMADRHFRSPEKQLLSMVNEAKER